MRRMILYGKTLAIFALAALSIYMTSRLWLVDFTNRHFFLYIEARFAPRPPDGHDAFVRPFRMAYGVGDGYFRLIHGGITNDGRIAESYEWTYGHAAIGAVLRSGNFIGVNDASFDEIAEILQSPAMIFEYNFPINGDTFAEAFSGRTGAGFANQDIETFYAIVILPPLESDSRLRAFFIGDTPSGGRIWEFALSPGGRRDSSLDFVQDIRTVNPETQHFTLSKNCPQGRVFAFLPQAPRGFVFHPIQVTNPYENAFGALHLASVRARIESFFPNPATITEFPRHHDGVYTFSNQNTAVRYLVGDILEYTSFRPIGRTAGSGFIQDFSAAIAFIEADAYVANEIFLAEYEVRGREHVFWFNYTIGNFPLTLENPWPTGPDCIDPLPYPIEVVVDHGRVVRYRRITYNFHEDFGRSYWMDLSPYQTLEFFELGFYISAAPSLYLQVSYYSHLNPDWDYFQLEQ